MATYTTYLNLKKPEGGERYALADFNANWDKIEAAYLPRRPVYKTISATSQSALDSALAEECASLAYGNFEVIELLGNWSGGTSPTSGARSLATVHRLNLSGAYYMCYVHFTGATGYYYSNAWHWDLGMPALNSKLATSVENHSDWLTSTESADSGTMLYVQKMGKLITLNLRTTGRVHTDSDTLANLPVGYRPINTIDVPCWINGTGPGVCRLQTDGVVRTWVVPSGTASSGRVYLYAAYLTA